MQIFVTCVFFLFFPKVFIYSFGVSEYGKFSVNYSCFAVLFQIIEFTLFIFNTWMDKRKKYSLSQLFTFRKSILLLALSVIGIANLFEILKEDSSYFIIFLIGSTMINYWYFLSSNKLKEAFFVIILFQSSFVSSYCYQFR